MPHKLILVALPWHSDRIIKGIGKFAIGEDWHLDVQFRRNRTIKTDRHYDGAITNGSRNPAVDAFFESFKQPWIELKREPGSKSWGTVTADDYAIGALAAEYFLAKGFKHFASYVEFNESHGRLRIDGFRNKLAEQNISSFCIDYWKANQKGEIKHDIIRWLSTQIGTLPKPIAIFATTDDFAYNVLEACIYGDIKVPEEVSILGSNNSFDCEFASVPLSSVDANLEELGYLGAKKLSHCFNNNTRQQHLQTVPPLGIVERMSTETKAIQDPTLVEALHYIRKNFHKSISGESIAKKIGITRGHLYELFQVELQTTVGKEMGRLRLEKAKRLLTDRQRKVAEIAWACGFKNRESFSRFFKKQTQLSVGQYRDKHNL